MDRDCEAMRDRIADRVSGVLPADQAKVLDEHLRECSACGSYLAALQREDEQLGALFAGMEGAMGRGASKAVEAVKHAAAKAPVRNISLWRIIMKSRITKLATAAGIGIVILLSLMVWDRSVQPAYAVDQTIEAMRNVEVVHIFGRDWDDAEVEVWLKANAETGMTDSCSIDERAAARLTVGTPTKTFHFDRKANTVTIIDGSAVMTWVRWGRFFEDMRRITERVGGEIHSHGGRDPETQQRVIVLQMTSDAFDIEALIDPESKLPIRVYVVRGDQPHPLLGLKHADRIEYGQPLPEGIFDFEIPEGAQVVRERHPIRDQQVPEAVIAYAMRFHAESRQRAGAPETVHVNSHLYVIDEDMTVSMGGIGETVNTTDETWLGEEVNLCGTDLSNIELFDENGKKQEARLVQKKLLPGGRFRIYWKVDTPWPPGEKRRYLLTSTDKTHFPAREAADDTYRLDMRNDFGAEVVENFFLILPGTVKLRKSSADFSSHERMGTFDIYVWQKRHSGKQTNLVNVELTRLNVEAEK